MAEGKRSVMGTVKLAVVILAVVVLLIIAFQNLETAETRVLWTSVQMPRTVLLLLALAIGFGLGVLSMYVRRWRRM